MLGDQQAGHRRELLRLSQTAKRDIGPEFGDEFVERDIGALRGVPAHPLIGDDLPTSIAFTRTLCGAPSPARILVSAMPAARDTAVGAPFGRGAFAPIFSTLMIRPQRRCFIWGITSRQKRIAWNSFSSRSSCHISSVIWSNGMAREMPALFTMMSTLPNVPITAS